MIFALFDYVQYHLKRGRYGADQKDAAMGYLSHYGEIPDGVISELIPSDVIFTQRLDSLMSWGPMYFGSASVDHVGVYIGNGLIAHMTLSGPRRHHLNVVARGARVLAVRPTVQAMQESFSGMDDPGGEYRRTDGGYHDRSSAFWHRLLPDLQLFFYLPRILTGYYPAKYKWQFTADIFLIALLLDIPFWFGVHIVVALPMAAIAGVRTAYNLVKYRLGRKTNNRYRVLSHPDIAYRGFFTGGGIIFAGSDTYVLGPWGIMPIGMLRSLMHGATSEGSLPDDLQEIANRIRHAVDSGEYAFARPRNQP
jgi:hypothetical protein